MCYHSELDKRGTESEGSVKIFCEGSQSIAFYKFFLRPCSEIILCLKLKILTLCTNTY